MMRIEDMMVIGMTGWLTFSLLIVLLAGDSWQTALSVLATLVTIGLLISAELVSGYGTRALHDKVTTLAWAGFLVFIVVIIARISEILTS